MKEKQKGKDAQNFASIILLGISIYWKCYYSERFILLSLRKFLTFDPALSFHTVKNRTLHRVDISMSDCSNSWQVFGESWYITFLLIQCDISTFHKQLPTIWTIGHRYIYSIQSSVFRVWSGSDLKKINWFRIVSWYVTCLQGWCKNKYGSYLSVDLSYHTRPWTISKLGSINCVLPKYWSKI